ncbi:MAG: hypothetical protein QNK04_09365 [Myxococcota bacterium]|nr:hypothetical protein [Myxococcota bacterium]
MTQLRSLLTGSALFAFALLVRALPASTVLAGGRVHFLGTEAYEHLRRIRYAIENFPSPLHVDPFTAFPNGASASWPPLFDLVMAILLLPVSAVRGLPALERAAAWMPPLFGAATVVAVWLLGRRYFGERIGLGAGLFLAVLGGHFLATQVSAFEPAAAMSLASTALLAATMAALSSGNRRAAVATALLAALVLLLAPEGLLYAVTALGALAVQALAGDAASRVARLRRLGFAVGLFAVVAAGGLLLLPWSGSLSEAWQLAVGGTRSVFRGTGAGTLPLFGIGASFDGRVAARNLSYLVYVYPFVLTAALGEALGAERRAPLFFLIVWSCILFAASAYERRFLDVFSVSFALGAAWSIGALAGRLRVGSSDASGVVGLAVLVMLLPLRSNYVPHLRNLFAGEGAAPELSRTARIDRIRFGVASWLEANSPPVPGWLGGPGKPDYGVLAPAEAGPTLRYVGRRATLVDGVGRNGEHDLGTRFWSSAHEDAYRALESLGARYVVVRYGDLREPDYPRSSIYRTLSLRNGSGVYDASLPAAGRLRMLYESALLQPGPRQQPLYRIFLFVRGARIEGRAAPGARVRLVLDLVSHDVRPLPYVDHAVADDDGRYRFRVPYSEQEAAGRVKAAGAYELRCGGERAEVRVTERQVRRGETVAGPDLCLVAPSDGATTPPPRGRRRATLPAR